ncbi:hypothetical protein Lal_00012915 [Lupinus albus]|nr:hypothetical protein Lal_00012915 [Lupinus albus]
MNSWNQLSCSTLPRIASDHHPLLLCFDLGGIPRSSFKFQKMWLSHPDCQRLVSEVWKEELVGCPMFVLSQKLRNLKKEFKTWNVQVRVKQAMSNVAAIQDAISSSGSDDDLLNQEHLAQGELLQALVVEEEFWRGKARINWQMDGDRNTSFFHKITKIRQASKALSSLRDGDTILVNQEQIAQHTLAYFTDLYASPNDARPNHLIQSVIPALFSISRNQDKLIWQGTNNGILSLKDAFACIKPDTGDINWGKLIWTKFIPPSKSFSTWRLFHHKMPTDENLQKRGCHLASMCSNCYSQIETSNHVFLTCSFVVHLWDWLGGIFKIHFNTNSIESLFLVCNRQWCPQVKGVLVAAIINTINTAWFCRNSSRFNGKKQSLVQAKSRIKFATSLAGERGSPLEAGEQLA